MNAIFYPIAIVLFFWSILGAVGEPATGLMSEWLKMDKLEDMNPPPTQPID